MTNEKDNIDVSVLHKLLRYEPENGCLFWRPRGSEFCLNAKTQKWWNKRFAGTEALACVHHKGYKQGRIFQEHYAAHRVVWALVYGSWPDVLIDHVDGNKTNNLISNLRVATWSQINHQTNKVDKTKTASAFAGVHRDRNSWRSHIHVNGAVIYLGNFKTEKDAHEAYKDKSLEIYGDFSPFSRNGKPPLFGESA